MNSPEITVVLPVYNGGRYLRRAIESVLGQVNTDWHLIISDDGSTDDSRAILDSFSDRRVTVIKQSQNLGIFGNLNFLLKRADTDVVKILCQDDELTPSALRRVLDFMLERPTCAISRCWSIGDNLRYGKGGNLELEGLLPTSLEPEVCLLAFGTFGNIVGNLCRATCRPRLFHSTIKFDETLPYAGDYDGWLRVAEKYGIELQNEELVFEGRHPEQNSVLLNQKNELYTQIDRILKYIETRTEAKERKLLINNWRSNFFTQRLPRYIRSFFRLGPAYAKLVYSDVPTKWPLLWSVLKYPGFKLKFGSSQRDRRRLLNCIIYRNHRAEPPY